MRASLTKSLGSAVVVASSLVLSLPGASAAQASPKNDSSTASTCVTPLGSSQSQSHGEYAEILNVKLEENRVVTASTNQPLSVPKKIEAINGVAKYSFPSDFGYSYATTNDGESLFISNAEHELVGLIDSVSAVDTDGATWAATMSVSNNVVTFSNEESGIRYYRIEYVGATAADADENDFGYRASLIGVPRNYVYNPKLGSLHDYCTKSPDEFPNPFGKNADFRGPCALHDMCYERKGCASRSCDASLKSNLKNNCRATYSNGPTLASCLATAEVYWGVVRGAHMFSSCA